MYKKLPRDVTIEHHRKTNEIIWCNDRYLFNGKPLDIKHWSRDRIILASDIYTDGRMDEHKIRNSLTQEGGYFFEIKQIKKALPQTLQNTEEENNIADWNREAILQQSFSVPQLGPKPLDQLTSKDIYNIFNLSRVITIPSHQYWIDKLGVPSIDWIAWFSVNLNNKFLPRPCKDYNFRIFHGLVRTENKLRYMKHKDGTHYSDGKCVVCKSGENENVEHVLYDCSFIGQIWHLTESLAKCIIPNFTLDKENAITGFRPAGIDKKALLVNVVLSITRFHIWKIRNRIKYNKEEVSYGKSYLILKWNLKQHFFLLKSGQNFDQSLIQTIEYMENEL